MGVFVTLSRTSSSAIAERPRDASCLSVVSFNSTISRAQSSVISYFGFKLTIAYNYMLFCCLRGNVEASCRKHFLVTSCHQKKNSAACRQDIFIRFDRIHERDRWTDRQTDGQTDTALRHKHSLSKCWFCSNFYRALSQDVRLSVRHTPVFNRKR